MMEIASIPDAAAFAAFDEPGAARTVLGFELRPVEDGRTELVTETRIATPARASRLRFRLYWALIRPWSGLIRHEILAAVRRRAEGG